MRNVAQLPEPELGWLAALRDRGIGHSLELIHEQPAHPWTVEELARRAAMSRSALRRGSGCSVKSPLNTSRAGGSNSRRSEAAFSRAFKREVGQSPVHYRRDVRRSPT